MKKIASIILSTTILININSGILHSAPDRNIQRLAPAEAGGQASDEADEIKEKVSTLEEGISFLEKEISRDKDISSWGQNQIALRMTRDLLNRDLSEKKRLLDNIKKDFGGELKVDIEFIEQNLEKEKEIVSGILIDIGTIKYTQSYITETLQLKNEMMNTFKEKLKELKDRSEKAKKEEQRKEMKK